MPSAAYRDPVSYSLEIRRQMEQALAQSKLLRAEAQKLRAMRETQGSHTGVADPSHHTLDASSRNDGVAAPN